MKKQIVFGLHAIEAILTRQPEIVLELWTLKGRADERLESVINKAQQFGIKPQVCNRKFLDEKANSTQHQGVVACITEQALLNEHDLDLLLKQKPQPLLLILDGITDPHNLGACLRSADAAGVDGVIVPKDKSVGLTGTVRKVACGAAEVVPLYSVTNLARTMRQLQEQNIWILGAAGEANSTLYQANLRGGIAIAMGAEGKGLRRLTKEHCDTLISIPMAGLVSSLNVSVATGICLFEAVRQRS
ncbi:23S rRNA (guanosine(2251)-2'-O)-methyltransferase RlmB [Paraferrimonas sp. SM1919]|uniref:23S rRNA (guanosine(2251)-2'-O)-methyltransferase RlmB n=1 Tax=Paraferrimonas sp. SM1919 TaxID=2662263 RepID=UPI001969B83F|nr:23S rRNA (guanosine(2251)-2'-O)-methyltransferase RlmB [Paraferrimonas sp. SM1919]